jgi:peptidoglycan/LPS O-acetylase OafA/YrhL
MTSLKYRSDIDGLRAVAVLGVVIYHAFPWMIPGGFIGVDIFFVISGYLISGILYKGLKANGGDGNFSPFSFREFYARRIRRLFPALITMLVITMAYGWLILLPDEFSQLGKHVAAGTLFIQNIVFWQESGYFDTAANLKPLLHLWSLAVEEQFYIFFPPLLIVLWKKPKILVPAMVVLLIATFILNVVMSAQNGVSDFFLTPYRAWEFLGGSLLAWWHFDKGHQQSEEEEAPMYREAFSWIGAFLLILGMASIHTGDPYPGWRALLPVAGTLLLMEGGRSAWINKKILSNPGVVWIGLISYPLYLFHWPALSFVHIVKGESSKPGYILMALLVSLVLTVLTYYFIEKKIRHNKSRWVIPMLVGVFMLTGVIGCLSSIRIIQHNFLDIRIKKLISAITDRDSFDNKKPCTRSDEYFDYRAGGNDNKTLFVGDSNMMQYQSRIDKILNNQKQSRHGAVFITKFGVPPIPNVIRSDNKQFKNNSKIVLDLIKSDPKISHVVLAARWNIYFNADSKWKINNLSLQRSDGRDAAINDLGKLIAKIVSNNKKVTLVLTIPTGSLLDPRNMLGRTFTGPVIVPLEVLKKESFIKENGDILMRIASVAKQNGAEVIHPMDYLCTNGVCIAEDMDGIPIRYDDGHLRPGYVRDHVKYLDFTVEP